MSYVLDNKTEIEEIIFIRLKGIKRTFERMKEKGLGYRSGDDSLETRLKKRDSLKETDKLDESPGENLYTWERYREHWKGNRGKWRKQRREEKKAIDQGVMFIDFTEHSELTHRIRQKLKKK